MSSIDIFDIIEEHFRSRFRPGFSLGADVTFGDLPDGIICKIPNQGTMTWNALARLWKYPNGEYWGSYRRDLRDTVEQSLLVLGFET